MCKCNSETINHLLFHCLVAVDLWAMVLGLFGESWVMPKSAVELLTCQQGQFGCHCNGHIWIVVSHCLMCCIWKERNSRCFEDSECSLPDLKLFFFQNLIRLVVSMEKQRKGKEKLREKTLN